MLRDDKTVTYIKITMNEEVPYLSFTRTPLDDKATYIGPFYGKLAVEKAVRILRKIFPYYTKPYTGHKTLNTDLGLTPGIEIGKSTPAEYKKTLKKLIRYLEGDREKLLKDLRKEMKAASKNGNFEEAAKARDELMGLSELKKKIVFSSEEFLDISSDQALTDLQKMLGLNQPPRRIEGYDISHQSGTNAVGSMVVFINGAATRENYRKFKIRGSGSDDLKSMVEVISRRLKHTEWELPDLIILDGGITQVNAILPLVQPLNIPVIGRDKSGDHSKSSEVKIIFNNQLINLDKSSHIARLIARVDEESHRFAITYHTLLKRKSMLK